MKTRLSLLTLFLGGAFLSLWLRVFYLQVIKGRDNELLAEENRIALERISPPRGVIYDREGRILVRNREQGREYLYPRALAHILGYVAEASADELDLYQLGDVVGKMGIEKEYDLLLRGRSGGVVVEKDVQGETVRELTKQEPKQGEDLHLTLDLDLQKKALDLLRGRKGAIVAVIPETGEVLALASSPSFDPNLFTVSQSSLLNDLLGDPDQPMFNRAISGLYPPGSIFKIVTAIAGLETGKIDADTRIEDTGEIKISNYGREFIYSNWYYTQYGKKEGILDLVRAIKRSNDIFFYKTGEWVGIAKLVDWAKYFGLGQALGIDLPGEADGLVPTPEWKKEAKTEAWYLGDTYITSIGQGNLLLTPLQVNQMALVIASGGRFCAPHLVKGEDCHPLEIKSENLALVKEGMVQACAEGGTGAPFFDFEPSVGCKTGTAEYGDPENKTHAWFTVFAPVDNPEILVTVLLEGAGEGSQAAAPIAKEILEYWFRR